MNVQDLDIEDLIAPRRRGGDAVAYGLYQVAAAGRLRAQKRGGRGRQATATKEDDFIDNLFIANTHDYMLCFSNRGTRLLAQGLRGAAGHAARAASRSSICCR